MNNDDNKNIKYIDSDNQNRARSVDSNQLIIVDHAERKTRTKKNSFIKGIALGLCCAIIGSAFGAYFVYTQTQKSSTRFSNNSIIQSSTISKNTNKPALSGESLSPKEIGKIGREVVVSIIGTREAENTNTFFFGSSKSRSIKSAGSGVIISSNGYIVTNNHVVSAENMELRVVLDDSTEYPATIIGRDPVTDIAVIKIDATNLTPAIFGNSDDLELGDQLVALGYALGEFENSLSVGYVSGLHRSVPITDKIDDLTNLIQHSAAINEGNSGGGLFNEYGELIGINVAKLQNVGVEGLGFAIPSNEAKRISELLIQEGRIIRPFIGIQGGTVPEEASKLYGVPTGFIINEITPGGGAEKAGLAPRDIITTIDGVSVSTVQDINTIKYNKEIGDTLEIEYFREGHIYQTTLILGEPTA